jgi:carboxyl-terminal processing protease
MPVRFSRLIGMMFAASACAGTTAKLAQPAREPLEAGVAVASFDSLWTIVYRTHVDTAFVSSKWVKVRDSLRPRALSAASRQELDALLADALHTIPESHFYIIPARVAIEKQEAGSGDGRGATGLEVRIAENRGVAWRVSSGSPADKAGIRPGQVLNRVGDFVTAKELLRIEAMPVAGRQRAKAELLQKLNGALSPSPGDTVVVEMAAGSRPITLSLVAEPGPGRISRYANLPPIAGVVKWSRIPTGEGKCVGTVGFNIWLPEFADDIERAIDSVRTCTGIVVDLRGNPGGLGAMVMRFGGYFVDSMRSLGTMKDRQLSLKFVINPQRSRNDGSTMAPFQGRVAILTDPITASTSEIFATGMQRIGRARVFGERSAGAALPAMMTRLPSGDVFVHAVADFIDPDGKRIEGAGTIPDVEVPLSINTLSQGRDGALDEAVRWISG